MPSLLLDYYTVIDFLILGQCSLGPLLRWVHAIQKVAAAGPANGIPYSGLFSRRLYFANFAMCLSSKIKILNVGGGVVQYISIREITFREQELNWLFAKYKRLENNPLYGIIMS